MRAAVTTGRAGADAFEVTQLPDPTPGPGDLVLRVAANGICGSDLSTAPFLPPGVDLNAGTQVRSRVSEGLVPLNRCMSILTGVE